MMFVNRDVAKYLGFIMLSKILTKSKNNNDTRIQDV